MITSVDDTHELKLQLRGYEALPPQLSARQAEHVEASGRDVEAEEVTEGHQLVLRAVELGPDCVRCSRHLAQRQGSRKHLDKERFHRTRGPCAIW